LQKYRVHLQSFLEEVNGQKRTTISNKGSRSKIWVLGSKNPNADKSVQWDDKFPNFTDADIVVINLQSLNKNVIHRINKDEYKLARDLIWDRFIQGSTLIFITARHTDEISGYLYDEPQYIEIIKQENGNNRYSRVDFPIDYLCPLKLRTIDVPRGSNIVYATDHPYSEYLKLVKRYDFFYELSYASLGIFQGLVGSALERHDYHAIESFRITDRAGHSIGGIYQVPQLNCKGILAFLPPLTDISFEKGIDKILEACGRHPIKENPPGWVYEVPFHPIDQLRNKLCGLQQQKDMLVTKIISMKQEEHLLKKHYRLLYETGTELDDAVYDVFKLLGFHEIRKIRGPEKEDWIFEFKSLTHHTYGIIEVKGVEKQISKADVQQCEGWVMDYTIDNKNAKGILIANQFRLRPFIGSKDVRLKIEHNLNKYANSRNICIIPSPVLFDSVNSLMKGRTILRNDIENIIINSKGALERF